VCRLLNYMGQHGYTSATPVCPEPLAARMPRRLWIEDFPAGYMQRALPRFPKQGDEEPWINPQNYRRDRKMFRESPIDDGALVFGSVGADVGLTHPDRQVA